MKLKIVLLICAVFGVMEGLSSENQDEYDDSDMYMEPLDDHLPSSSNVEPQKMPQDNSSIEEIGSESSKEDLGPVVEVLKPQRSVNSKLDENFEENSNQKPLEIHQEDTDDKSTPADADNQEAQPIIAVLTPQAAPADLQMKDSRAWYPSFQNWQQPPLGHSRPFYNGRIQPDGAYSQRVEPPFQQELAYAPQKFLELRGFKDQYRGGTVQQQVQSDANVDILGDGNFGVIQGGTFYAEKDAYDAESSDHFDDFSYYGANNGHGRPSSFGYGKKPNPKPHTHKQFENFRDFAEINAGVTPERQYSHYVVVYTNKNATKNQNDEKNTKPKNIIEQLTMLDLEPKRSNTEEEIMPQKKLSNSKRKLALLLPEKKHEAKLLKKEREMISEPLLALS